MRTLRSCAYLQRKTINIFYARSSARLSTGPPRMFTLMIGERQMLASAKWNSTNGLVSLRYA
jgi:hypothetical protein